MIEELKGPIEIPWTVTQITADDTRQSYDDVTEDGIDDAEWERAHEEPQGERGSTRRRIIGKGQPPQKKAVQFDPRTGPRGEKRGEPDIPFEESGPSSGSRGESHRPTRQEAEGADNSALVSEDCTSPLEKVQMQIAIDLPESRRGMKRFINNPAAYLCSRLKRRQVEISEKRLTEDEKAQFVKAKEKEVQNFIGAQCFEVAREWKPGDPTIMGMRWLLTWKTEETPQGERKKAKARAIVLGYQDDKYEERQTSAPTPSKEGRQLFFQLCAWKKLRVKKGDVTGAFLQGLDLTDEMWCAPLPEICKAMNVKEGTPMILKKAAYGLVQAPIKWYESVHAQMISMGFRRLLSEPCCWVLVVNGELHTICHIHEDDLLIAGQDGDPLHEESLKRLRERFKWGQWEEKDFIQCGIHVVQNEDFSFSLSQERFIDDLEEISLTRDRQRMEEEKVSESERQQMRAVLGSMSWLCGQTSFLFSADVGFLLTTVPVATVKDLNTTNQLVRTVKKCKKVKYMVHSFPSEEEIEFTCWADAGHANRPNQKDSAIGVFVGASTRRLREGHEENVSPIYWRSGKADRVARSPACAEALAGVDGEDELLYLRVLWWEMCGGNLEGMHPDHAARQVRAMLITDAKNLYDKLHRPVPIVKGAEKRSTLECLALRSHLEKTQTPVRWVHSQAMLANALTKPQEKGTFWRYLHLNFRWRITYDEEMLSAKTRSKLGIEPLASKSAHVRPTTVRHQPVSSQHASG